GSNLICKYDVVARVETSVDCGGAMGIAVDETSGFVYITGGGWYGAGGGTMQVWNCSTTPFAMIQQTFDLGNPAGIAIANVSYNPLNLAKNDVVQGVGVPIGQNFTYRINFDNFDNAFDVTGVTVRDTMPAELDFVSETVGGVPGTGVFDPVSNTVTWEIGTILAGQAGPLIELVVRINSNAVPGTTITNFATIDSDQTPPTTETGDDPDDPTGTPGTVVLPPTNGSIFGQVTLNGGGLHGVVVSLMRDGSPAGAQATDEFGDYEFGDLPGGDYVVEVQVPLGMSPVGESVVPVKVATAPVEVNFALTNVATNKVCDIWWWKLRLQAIKDGIIIRGMPTRTDFDRYGRLIFDHFYNRIDGFEIQILDVTYASGPRAMTFDDFYDFMFRQPYDPSYEAKSERAMLTCLLNIASGRQSQLKVVTADGATASQALTYFAGLYMAGGTANCYAVYVNLQKMYLMKLIPAGIVPLGTPNIMYKEELALPSEFALEQNYPNPFNPTTTIGFSLPVACQYRLTIINVAGQTVAEYSGWHEAGDASVVWDASRHPSGVYLYRLTPDRFTDSKKMLLIK
ncbi:MAG: T9SS type A sorting domain-containing protein, partial [Candidatus Zixiibacteriota bacterium]